MWLKPLDKTTRDSNFEGWSSYFSACCFFHPKKILPTKNYAPTLWLFVWQDNQPQTRPEFFALQFWLFKKVMFEEWEKRRLHKNPTGLKGPLSPSPDDICPGFTSHRHELVHLGDPLHDAHQGLLSNPGFLKREWRDPVCWKQEDKQNTFFWFILSSNWCFLHESLTIRKNIFGLLATTVDP